VIRPNLGSNIHQSSVFFVFFYFLTLAMIAMAAMAISMIMALTSAVVTMFVLVCFDMMPNSAQTMTRS
jgi:hypothetical protein